MMFKPIIQKKIKKFKISRLIPVGSKVVCADSSGVKLARIIGFKNMQSADKRRLSGGVGSQALVVTIKGKRELKHKVLKALIIRQKSTVTRFEGLTLGKIAFRDNAITILDENWAPTKAVIKGPIAKEVLSIRPNYSKLNGNFK